MAIQLVFVVGCDVEGVQCVVDSGRVERGRLVEGTQGAVDATAGGLLLGFLCAGALGLWGERGLFFGEEGGFFGFLARGFCCLFGGGVATVELADCEPTASTMRSQAVSRGNGSNVRLSI